MRNVNICGKNFIRNHRKPDIDKTETITPYTEKL